MRVDSGDAASQMFRCREGRLYQTMGTKPEAAMTLSCVMRLTLPPLSMRRRAVATICLSCISVTAARPLLFSMAARSSGTISKRVSESMALKNAETEEMEDLPR